MDYSKFSIRIEAWLRQQLEKEASDELRSLNNQISVILKERYNAHAPPTSTRKQSSQFHSKTNSRRVKTKAETA